MAALYRPDVVVTRAFEVPDRFNAIASCTRKEYPARGKSIPI